MNPAMTRMLIAEMIPILLMDSFRGQGATLSKSGTVQTHSILFDLPTYATHEPIPSNANRSLLPVE